MTLPKTLFSFIYHFVSQQWAKFIFLIFSSIVWGINDSIFPYFLKHIVNTLQHYQGNSQGIYSALKWVIMLVTFWLLTEVILRTQGVVQIYTFPRFRANVREAVFTYVKAHSHEYFSNHLAGEIAKKLADLPTSCQTILEIICLQFTTAIVGAVIVLGMMWSTKPIFAIILFIWLILHLGLTLLLLKRGNNSWESHSDSVSILNGKIVDVLTNMLNVRLFARHHHERENLRKFQQDEIIKSKKAMWLMEITRMGLGLNGLFLIFGMIFVLLYGWTQHWVTLGDFTQVGMQTFWLMGWIWFVSYQMTVFAREAGTVRDALNLIKQDHGLTDKPNAAPISISQGEINFSDVTFAYQQKHQVFNNLNIFIPAGQKIGLVGFSGSGKSTFVNLILRFFDLHSGTIFIDKQDICSVTQNSLRSQIAMIPQEPALFHRSLMENIRYGRLDASDEEVIEAAKLAHCHEFIETLDNGYHSLVGERGIKLSGGQRQRIAIARAILKNAPILILDEATSSLDSVTEKLIQKSLDFLMQGRTTIVVAHRLSTLAHMDRIVVFHNGKIIEQGNKDSLLKIKGHFSQLWEMQTDGFLPEKNLN